MGTSRAPCAPHLDEQIGEHRIRKQLEAVPSDSPTPWLTDLSGLATRSRSHDCAPHKSNISWPSTQTCRCSSSACTARSTTESSSISDRTPAVPSARWSPRPSDRYRLRPHGPYRLR